MKNITNSFKNIFVVFTNYLENNFVHKMGVLIFLNFFSSNSRKNRQKQSLGNPDPFSKNTSS